MKQHARALAVRLKTSRILGLAFKLALTIAAFWFALKDVDFVHLGDILATQRSAGIIEASVLIVAQIVLGSLRWRMVLMALSQAETKAISILKALKLYYISIFFNCCLPGTVGGDVIRVWLAKSEHIPLPVAIHSVIIDRLIALVALGILVLATLSSLGGMIGFDARYWIPVILLVVGAGLWILLRATDFLTPYQHILLVHWLLQFLDCLRVLVAYPRTSLQLLTYAVLSHICFCLCGYALAQSLNIELTVMQSITLIPLVLLITTIPISIGGWGVREVGMVGLLGFIGVPQAAALMLSIEMGFIVIFLSLPAAVLWLAHRRHVAQEKAAA